MHLKTIIIFVSFLVQLNTQSASAEATPIVLWHGMGDTCCFPFSLGKIAKMLKSNIDGVYVKSIEIGGNLIRDYESGFFIHPNKQVDFVCNLIANDPKLKNGFNAIGFSQGGQFLRAVAQRCPMPQIKNLISFGGQHQGVFGLPNCPSLSRKTCENFRKMLNTAAYTEVMQDYLVQATYWHDPLNEEKYRNGSTFLADINNERVINQSYIDNLQKLEKFILVKFTEDTIVQPKESQWFEFYEPNQDVNILPLKKSALYTEDKLGLQQMMTDDKLVFLESVGNHLQFTTKWFIDNILPYLKEEIDRNTLE